MKTAAPSLEHVFRAMGRPKSWVVGGWVRDRLLGRTSHDLDIVVAGDRDVVKHAAYLLGRQLGVRAHLLGREPCAVWRVVGAQCDIEIWPLGDSSIEQDIRRRDFSCNALMSPLPEGGIIDLVGGVDDIRKRLLRGVDRSNFERDPVRLLRASRFLAQLRGFELEEGTRDWLRDLAPSLAVAPKERVGKELWALLGASDAARGLSSMLDLGLMAGASPDSSFDEDWLNEHLEAVRFLSSPSTHPLRPALDEAGASALLSVLVRVWGCPVRRKLAAYAWPREIVDDASKSAGEIDEIEAILSAAVPARRESLARLNTAVPALVAVGSAMACARGLPLRDWRNLWRLFCRNRGVLLTPKPVLMAAEVKRLAEVEMGPRVGELMRELEGARVRGEIRSPSGARRLLLDIVRRAR